MKPGKNLNEFATELQLQYAAKHDYIVPASRLMVEGPNVVTIPNTGSYDPTKHFQQQTATLVGYPWQFWEQTKAAHPDQWQSLVNALLGAHTEPRMVRTLFGNARALVSDKYYGLDNWQIAEAALEVIAQEFSCAVVSAEITDARMYLKVVMPGVQAEIKPGDVVQSGWMITNSEVGLGEYRVQPFIERLICANGAIRPDSGLRGRHVTRRQEAIGDGNFELLTDRTRRLKDIATLSNVRAAISEAADEVNFKASVKALQATTERKIEGDPLAVIEVTSKRFGLLDSERPSLLTHLINGGDISQYGLIQAITATAQDPDISYERSIELETVGGKLIELPAAEWAKIAVASKN